MEMLGCGKKRGTFEKRREPGTKFSYFPSRDFGYDLLSQVLVVHMPTMYLANDAALVISILLRFVRQNGVERDLKMSSRRPHTCFFSAPDNETAPGECDWVLRISDQTVSADDTKS